MSCLSYLSYLCAHPTHSSVSLFPPRCGQLSCRFARKQQKQQERPQQLNATAHQATPLQRRDFPIGRRRPTNLHFARCKPQRLPRAEPIMVGVCVHLRAVCPRPHGRQPITACELRLHPTLSRHAEQRWGLHCAMHCGSVSVAANTSPKKGRKLRGHFLRLARPFACDRPVLGLFAAICALARPKKLPTDAVRISFLSYFFAIVPFIFKPTGPFLFRSSLSFFLLFFISFF